jgi:hypothetical protein
MNKKNNRSYKLEPPSIILGFLGLLVSTVIVLFTPIVFLIMTIYPFLWWAFALIAKTLQPLKNIMNTLKKYKGIAFVKQKTSYKPYRLNSKRGDSSALFFNRIILKKTNDINFNRETLKDIRLEILNLPKASFKRSYLKNVNLSYLNFKNADFEEADLRKSNLCFTNMNSANLKRTKLSGAYFNQQTKLPFSKEKAKGRGMAFLKTNHFY